VRHVSSTSKLFLKVVHRSVIDYIKEIIPYQRFAVAEWLMHLSAKLEVVGLGYSFGDISEIHFLESKHSPYNFT